MLLPIIGGLVGLMLLGAVYELISRAAERALPLQGRLFEVEGQQLHVTETGQGSSTVVILPGAGDSTYSWVRIRNEIGQFARVISFDRPGLGSSPPGPAPDAQRAVRQLEGVLAATNLPGPYILVGHSLGGLIARLYAIKNLDKIAGMVMVDSSHEFLADDAAFRKGMSAVSALLKLFRATSPFGLPRFLGQVFGLMPMYPERSWYRPQLTTDQYAQWTASVYRTAAGRSGGVELEAAFGMLAEAKEQLRTSPEAPQFGQTPLVVLTNPGFGESWIEMHRELAARSGNSVHWVVDRKGHSIQMTRPDLVIKAVRHVLDQGASRVAG